MKRLGGEYDLEAKGSAFSCTPSAAGANTVTSEHLQMWYYAGLKGMVFFTRSLVLL